MGQEFFIKSSDLESKVRQLLPSQGGLGAGFDLTASTQIVPIVDLTESAEGSNVRQDLQTAFSFTNTTAFEISNTTSTIINNTGYYRVLGQITARLTTDTNQLRLTDGVTTKVLVNGSYPASSATISEVINYDFNIFLAAGQSLVGESGGTTLPIRGITRQIADIEGNLIQPT